MNKDGLEYPAMAISLEAYLSLPDLEIIWPFPEAEMYCRWVDKKGNSFVLKRLSKTEIQWYTAAVV